MKSIVILMHLHYDCIYMLVSHIWTRHACHHLTILSQNVIHSYPFKQGGYSGSLILPSNPLPLNFMLSIINFFPKFPFHAISLSITMILPSRPIWNAIFINITHYITHYFYIYFKPIPSRLHFFLSYNSNTHVQITRLSHIRKQTDTKTCIHPVCYIKKSFSFLSSMHFQYPILYWYVLLTQHYVLHYASSTPPYSNTTTNISWPTQLPEIRLLLTN